MEVSLTSCPLLTLFLALLPLLSFLYLRKRQHDPKKQPRVHGLKSYPVVGVLPHLVKNHHRFLEWSADVVTKSPTHTISFKVPVLPGGAAVITANPANVEHILKTNFGNYPKGEPTVSTIEDFLGHGIFNSDGEQWLWQRKAASYEFSKRSLRSFVVDTVRFEVVERLLPLLERAARDGGRNRTTLDVQDVLERFAFDNICCVAFGHDPACLAADEDEEGGGMAALQSAEFMRAFNDVQDAVMARFMAPARSLWRVKKLLNLEPERRLREALATVRGYAGRIVHERRNRAEDAGHEHDFLSRFAASGEHSDEGLIDVVTNFIIAGRDTTSSALTWFFWLVSGRPDVEAKIVGEIRRVRAASSQGTTTGAGAATFSFDELRDMHYIHAAITESMRLYPPVPMDSRRCEMEDTLPDGTFVGAGWQASYSAFAMARVAELWGSDCEEFRPERWLGDDGAFRPESPFKYPVFHAGPRACLGKDMAYIQMKSIVACAFERFSFRFVGGEERPGLVLSFTLRMNGGLPMQVSKRS